MRGKGVIETTRRWAFTPRFKEEVEAFCINNKGNLHPTDYVERAVRFCMYHNLEVTFDIANAARKWKEDYQETKIESPMQLLARLRKIHNKQLRERRKHKYGIK